MTVRQAKGELEYHVPARFTDERPAVLFSHAHHSQSIADHALASQIPTASGRPAVVGDPNDFNDLMLRGEDGPKKLDDYLYSDLPQLALHVVSFNDATIITLNWPHTTFDALGQRALLDAWVQKLNGLKTETPVEADIDPLSSFGTKPTESHKLADKRVFTPGLVQYALRNIADFAWRKHENRMVCIPASWLTDLREQCLKELSEGGEGYDGTKEDWVSEGDVLCAWWTRVSISHMNPNSSTMINLNNAYSLRDPLKSDLLPSDRPYLSNAIGFVNVLMPANEILQKPISYTAAYIRRCIKEYGTRDQMEAFGSMVRETSSKLPPFFGNPGMHMVTYSNWTKAKLYEVDFSSAVVPGSASSSGTERRRPGKPSYIQNCQFGFTLPNGFPIIGRDLDGNYWLSGFMTQGTWAKLDSLLEKEWKDSTGTSKVAP